MSGWLELAAARRLYGSIPIWCVDERRAMDEGGGMSGEKALFL
jgi:hypothetical protein